MAAHRLDGGTQLIGFNLNLGRSKVRVLQDEQPGASLQRSKPFESSVVEDFAACFNGNIAEKKQKLSRQETPNSVKIKTKCNVCVTTLCEHSMCDHSM